MALYLLPPPVCFVSEHLHIPRKIREHQLCDMLLPVPAVCVCAQFFIHSYYSDSLSLYVYYKFLDSILFKEGFCRLFFPLRKQNSSNGKNTVLFLYILFLTEILRTVSVSLIASCSYLCDQSESFIFPFRRGCLNDNFSMYYVSIESF